MDLEFESSTKLKELMRLKDIIETNLRQLENLHEARGDVQSSWQSTDRVTGGKSSHNVESTALRIIALEETLKDELETYYEEYKEAKEIFKTLNRNQELIMNLRYLEGLKWKEIADITKYSIDSVYKFHRDAINELGKHGN